MRSNRLITALLIGALLMYALVDLATEFAADDYCQLADVREYGALGAVTHIYQTWSGRFSQALASNSLYALFGTSAPVVGVLLCIALGGYLAWRLWRVAGLMLVAAFLLALGENVWQGVYWLPGNVTYVAPIILTLALLKLNRLPQGLLAVLVVGFNETIGLSLLLAGILYRHPAMVWGAVIGALLVFLAPGNAIRASYLTPLPLLPALGNSMATMLYFAVDRLVNTPVALLAALVAGMTYPRSLDRRLLAALSFAILLAIGSSVYFIGGMTPRAYVLPTAALIGLCFHAGQVFGVRQTISYQLQYTATALVFLGALAFGSAARLSNTAFVDRAGLDRNDTQWVADCIARLERN